MADIVLLDHRGAKDEDIARVLEMGAREIERLRDVLTWSEENCPGKCAGRIGLTLRG
jgi:hypothetical protein